MTYVIYRVFTELKEKRMVSVLAVNTIPNIQEQSVISEQQDLNKTDEEIIVDGDSAKDSHSSANASPNVVPFPTNTGVVVIDDDSKSSPQEKPKTLVQSNTSAQQLIQEQQTIEVEECKTKSTLEELISWLHEKSPLTIEQLTELCITMDDFKKALKCVQPSAKREGFATVPDVTWDDVGSLQDIREELKISILVSQFMCVA